MRVVFVGSQNIGYVCLEEVLKQGHDVVAVCTTKPDPHEVSWYKSVQELAESQAIPCEVQPDLKSATWVQKIRALAPDLLCVMGWRRLIAEEILAIAPLGSVAIHFSLLPKGRGFAPVNWAIINGETRTGATFFYLDREMDTGDIIAQVEVPIGVTDTAKHLNDRLTEASATMFSDALPRLSSKTAPRIPQDHSQATYYAKRVPEDGRLNWTQPAVKIYNQVRALTYPFPGAFCYCNKQQIYVWKASLLLDAPIWYGSPGQIVRFERGGPAWVLTGDGLLQIDQVQPADGEGILPAGEYLNSLSMRLW